MSFSIAIPPDDDPYWITSGPEIRGIFKRLARNRDKVRLHMRPEGFLLSMVLEVLDPDELVLDLGASDEENDRILSQPRIAGLASIDSVDFKFELDALAMDRYGGGQAFYVPLPARVHKLQRREFFRVPAPQLKPLQIQGTLVVEDDAGRRLEPFSAQVLDLSLGGLALLDLAVPGVEIRNGMRAQACTLQLPDHGQLCIDLQVVHVLDVTLPSGAQRRHAGCQFLTLSAPEELLLQRYIHKLERDQALLGR